MLRCVRYCSTIYHTVGVTRTTTDAFVQHLFVFAYALACIERCSADSLCRLSYYVIVQDLSFPITVPSAGQYDVSYKMSVSSPEPVSVAGTTSHCVITTAIVY
jgi:hypothetical protein